MTETEPSATVNAGRRTIRASGWRIRPTDPTYETYPQSFFAEIERRAKEPNIPEDEAHRLLGWAPEAGDPRPARPSGRPEPRKRPTGRS